MLAPSVCIVSMLKLWDSSSGRLVPCWLGHWCGAHHWHQSLATSPYPQPQLGPGLRWNFCKLQNSSSTSHNLCNAPTLLTMNSPYPYWVAIWIKSCSNTDCSVVKHKSCYELIGSEQLKVLTSVIMMDWVVLPQHEAMVTRYIMVQVLVSGAASG